MSTTVAPTRPATGIREYAFDHLRVRDEQAAEKLHVLCRDLSVQGEIGKGVAARIHNVGENIDAFTPAEIYSYLDPAATAAAVERDRSPRLQLINLFRNILIIAPLVFTWFAFNKAADQYQIAIQRAHDNIFRPFLELWQNGFDTGFGLTFSRVAVIDLVLYLLLVSTGVWADASIRAARGRARDAQEQVARASHILGEVSLANGGLGSRVADVGPWMTRVQGLLTDASRLIQQVSEQMARFQDSAAAIGQSAAAIGQSAAALGTSANNLIQSIDNIGASATQMAQSASETSRAAAALTGEVGRIPTVITGATSQLGSTIQAGAQTFSTSLNATGNRLGELTRQVENTANNSGRVANSIERTERDWDRTVRRTNKQQQSLTDHMARIHRGQERLARDLGQRPPTFWERLFGRRVPDDDYYPEPDQGDFAPDPLYQDPNPPPPPQQQQP